MDWSVTEHPESVTFSVTRPADGRGLYRAYAVGPGGKWPLGTLTPEEKRLTLTKTLGKALLREKGCWPILRVECCLVFPFTERPSADIFDRLFRRDPILRASLLRGEKPCYIKRFDGFDLRYPFRVDAPFPLLPLFCFAKVEWIFGERVLTFTFDIQELPRMPQAN